MYPWPPPFPKNSATLRLFLPFPEEVDDTALLLQAITIHYHKARGATKHKHVVYERALHRDLAGTKARRELRQAALFWNFTVLTRSEFLAINQIFVRFTTSIGTMSWHAPYILDFGLICRYVSRPLKESDLSDIQYIEVWFIEGLLYPSTIHQLWNVTVIYRQPLIYAGFIYMILLIHSIVQNSNMMHDETSFHQPLQASSQWDDSVTW